MTNLPITNSNPQSPASGTSTAQANGMADAQSAEPFGTLLAQQMEEAGTPASTAPSSAIVIATQATVCSEELTSEADQDKTLAMTDISDDPTAALAAMLQLSKELKTPVDKDATHNKMALAHSMTAGKAAAANIGAAQAREKMDLATANNQVSRNTPGLEPVNSATLINNLPHASLSTQDVAASIAAPAVMPNTLTSNNLPGTRQIITTPLGSNGWANEFSQKINWMSTQHNQIAELHLNPPDLGPLNVALKISDNQATALFTSPHAAVRDAVENALPKLRETLADNGIMLGNTTVSDQPPRDRDMERFMGQGSSAAARRDVAGETDLLTAAAQVAPVRRHVGMVDTFA